MPLSRLLVAHLSEGQTYTNILLQLGTVKALVKLQRYGATRYEMLKLLTVTETFFIRGRGLILVPGFSSPKEGRLMPDRPYLPAGVPNQGIVEVRLPDGTSFRVPYKILIENFHYTSVEAIEKNPHWVIHVALQDVEKAAVPPGSEIWIAFPDPA